MHQSMQSLNHAITDAVSKTKSRTISLIKKKPDSEVDRIHNYPFPWRALIQQYRKQKVSQGIKGIRDEPLIVLFNFNTYAMNNNKSKQKEVRMPSNSLRL